MLSEFFNNKNLKKTVNPDEIVAQGAALLASILKEEGNLKIIDINPISLGINSILYDDKQKKYLYDNMEILINKNVQLPYINEKFLSHIMIIKLIYHLKFFKEKIKILKIIIF